MVEREPVEHHFTIVLRIPHPPEPYAQPSYLDLMARICRSVREGLGEGRLEVHGYDHQKIAGEHARLVEERNAAVGMAHADRIAREAAEVELRDAKAKVDALEGYLRQRYGTVVVDAEVPVGTQRVMVINEPSGDSPDPPPGRPGGPSARPGRSRG